MRKLLKLKRIEGDSKTIAKTIDEAVMAQSDELQKRLSDGPRLNARKIKIRQM